jgi:hypothetical protein
MLLIGYQKRIDPETCFAKDSVVPVRQLAA